MKLDRTDTIRHHLFTNGLSSVPEIAEVLGVSEPTVRRDLAALEAEGAIVRLHGSAQLAENSTSEIAFESREKINLSAKRAIAEVAYSRLKPNSNIFLDAGTTVLQLARLIRMKPINLRVFTNCLPVAHLLMGAEGVSVTVLGGQLRPQNASLTGPSAEAGLENLWFDQLFLGVGAIGPDDKIYSADEGEARLNAVMLTRSACPIVLADQHKFGERLTYQVVTLTSKMRVISDNGLSTEWQARMNELGVNLSIANFPA
jgi:DeoR family fructose operon transcriptional repressor